MRDPKDPGNLPTRYARIGIRSLRCFVGSVCEYARMRRLSVHIVPFPAPSKDERQRRANECAPRNAVGGSLYKEFPASFLSSLQQKHIVSETAKMASWWFAVAVCGALAVRWPCDGRALHDNQRRLFVLVLECSWLPSPSAIQ